MQQDLGTTGGREEGRVDFAQISDGQLDFLGENKAEGKMYYTEDVVSKGRHVASSWRLVSWEW